MVFKLYPHQKELKEKANEEFVKGHSNVMVVSPAGSGKSVIIAAITKEVTEQRKRVLFMVHRKELLEQIAESLEQNEVDLEFVTILSVKKVKNRLEILPVPDLIITDETHHSKAKTYMAVYKKYSDVPKIGFTATPVRLSGEGFADVYDVLVEGESVSWLIEHHYLAPYTYYSLPLINRKQLKKQRGEFTNQSITEAMSDGKIYGEVVETYKEKANGEQAILYAHTIDYSKHYAEQFNAAGIPAVHVDSKTPKAEREKIMKGFKQKQFKILCNVDLISEGFNVPDCSTIILLRPTQSLTVFVQQSMRGMRYVPNKTSIIIDHVGNYLKHGLPDTERTWSLEKGLESERSEEAEKECPKCQAIFSNWIVKESEKYKVTICPVCSEEFWTEKESGDEQENAGVVLEEITQEEKLIADLEKISHLNHYTYRKTLLSIVKIFVSRNLVAEYENRRPPYNFPIQFAIREFLKYNQRSQRDDRVLYGQLQEIETVFGKKYHVTARNLKKYIQKIEPQYAKNHSK